MSPQLFRKTLLGAAIAAIFSSAASAGAIITPQAQWTGATPDGLWSTPGNWISPPSTGADVWVTDTALSGSSITNVIYTDTGVGAFNSVLVDGASASNMTLNQATDNLSTGALTVGDGGTGTFNQINSTTNVSGNLILGNQAAGNGTYTITGNTAQTNVNFVSGGNGSNPNGALIVGNAGTGSFTQGTDTLTDPNNQVKVAGDLVLGHQSGSSGAYFLNSGTLTVGGQAAVGGLTGSNGTFTQTGGSLILTNSANQPIVNPDYASVPPGSGAFGGKLAIGGGISSSGGNDGGSGTYIMTGGLIDATANGIEIGPTGTGTMNQSGGTVNTTFLTEGFSGTGTYNLSGTGTISSYSESVGYAGTGTFNQSGGTHTIASDLRVGVQYSTNSPGNGTYNLSNGLLNSGNTFVGQGETGSIVVTDSGTVGDTSVHTVSGNLILGTLGLPDGVNPQPAGNGSYSITGSSSQLNVNFVPGGNGDNGAIPTPTPNPNGALIVGESGTGSFTQGVALGTDTPSVNIAGDLVLGHQGLAGNPNPAAQDSVGTYTINGGTLTVGGNIGVGTASTAVDGLGNPANVFTQNGGTVTITGAAYGNLDYVGVGTNDHTGGLFIGGGAGPNNDGGTGAYNLNGGILNAGYIEVGHAGNGTFNQTGGTVNTGGLSFANAFGFGTYNLSGTGVINAGSESMNFNGSSLFNQSGGTNSVSGTLDLGFYQGTATYNLSGGVLTTGGMIVGDGTAFNLGGTPTGFFNQTGGTHTVSGDLIVGNAYGSTGTYTLSGESNVTLDVSGTIVLGVTGYGEFDQSGGKVTAGELDLGRNGTTPDPTGIYRLTGTGSLQVNNEIIGELGHGAFYQGDGSGNTTHTVTGALTIGDGAGIYHDDINGTHYGDPGYLGSSLDSVPPGRSGSYTLTDGTLSTGSTVVGSQGYGTFNQNGGLHAVGGDLIIGQQYVPIERGCGDGSPGNPGCNVGGSATGIYTLNSGGTLTVGGNAVVGDAGNGTFNHFGGDATVSGNLILGNQSTGNGTYTLSGGSLSITGFTRVGDGSAAIGGTGTFNQSGGTHTTDQLFIGSGSGTGTYNLSGTGVLNSGVTYVGEGGTAQFTQSGTSLFTTNYLNVGIINGSNARYDHNGGTLTVNGNLGVGSSGGTGKGTFNQTGGSLTAGGLYVNTGGTFNYSGGSLSVGNVVNDGAFHVTETNVSYTGSFTNNGSYISDPAVSHFNDLTVGNSGYLVGGAGDQFVISGSFFNNSAQSSQWNTLQADLVFDTSGSHTLTLAGTDLGATQAAYANNFAWGDLSLGSGASLTLTGNSSGGNALYVELLDLAGGLGQLSQISSSGNIYYDANLSGNSYLGGLQYALNGGGFLTPVTVPVPPAVWLFGSALAGFTLFGRRKTKA